MGRRLTLLLAALLALLAAAPTDALTTPAPGAQNCARAFLSADATHTPEIAGESPCTHPGSIVGSARIAAGCCVATKAGRGGAGPVRVGQAGEDAVRSAYDIGPKIKIDVAGTKRVPDGLTPSTLSEVKNVGSLSYTRQLRDYVQFAQGTGRRVDLYVRGGRSPTNLSGPLRDALSDPSVPIRLRRIP